MKLWEWVCGIPTHSSTHNYYCLARLPRTLAVPAVL
jgi:hypothetical protein